jgi:hypothetical protein
METRGIPLSAYFCAPLQSSPAYIDESKAKVLKIRVSRMTTGPENHTEMHVGGGNVTARRRYIGGRPIYLLSVASI